MADPSEIINAPAAAIQTAMGGSVFAAIMGWLPQTLALVAATIGACYYTICIWESKTIQHYINNRRMMGKAKKVARLKAKEKVIAAQIEALQLVQVARREAAARVEDATSEAAKLVVREDTATAIKHTPPRG